MKKYSRKSKTKLFEVQGLTELDKMLLKVIKKEEIKNGNRIL